jgi:beta-galactosidase
MAEYEAKKYNFELEKNEDGTVVNVDLRQLGVAGDNAWGLQAYEQYQIPPGDYEYEFYIHGSE